MPADASAKDVVAAAAKKGIKITPAYVYVIRSKTDAPKAAKPGRKAKGGRRAAARGAGTGSAEAQLRQAIAEIGLAKAREIFAEVEAAFAGR